MTYKPQHLLVEERGLRNQIKKIKDLIPKDNDFGMTNKYLQEQLTDIVESLEDIKIGIKHENDRILSYHFKDKKNKQPTFGG